MATTTKLSKEAIAKLRVVQKQLRTKKKSDKVQFNMYGWVDVPSALYDLFPDFDKIKQSCSLLDYPCGTTACIGGHILLNETGQKKFDSSVDYTPAVKKALGVKGAVARELENLCCDFGYELYTYDKNADDDYSGNSSSSYWAGLNEDNPKDAAIAIERFIQRNS